MKLLVEYEIDASISVAHRFWAKTRIDNCTYWACGSDWDDAKTRLIAQVRPLVMEPAPTEAIPLPEFVDIGGADSV
jgi:hypothetical protein